MVVVKIGLREHYYYRIVIIVIVISIISNELLSLLAPHGAQAVIAFRYYSLPLLLLLYFPNILLKPLKTNV